MAHPLISARERGGWGYRSRRDLLTMNITPHQAAGVALLLITLYLSTRSTETATAGAVIAAAATAHRERKRRIERDIEAAELRERAQDEVRESAVDEARRQATEETEEWLDSKF